ncbi:MAG: hypothetical protein R3B13_04295 [Polyangiaceae bacterium]
MSRLVLLLAAAVLVSSSAAAAPAGQQGKSEPTRKVRRVERLSKLVVKGRVNRPHIDVIVQRSPLHFSAGTIQYRHRRQAFERYE